MAHLFDEWGAGIDSDSCQEQSEPEVAQDLIGRGRQVPDDRSGSADPAEDQCDDKRAAGETQGKLSNLPRPDLMLEYGDRLGLVIEPESRMAVIKHFGDSVLAEASFSFVALGLGIALGALVGLIPIPIPGEMRCGKWTGT